MCFHCFITPCSKYQLLVILTSFLCVCVSLSLFLCPSLIVCVCVHMCGIRGQTQYFQTRQVAITRDKYKIWQFLYNLTKYFIFSRTVYQSLSFFTCFFLNILFLFYGLLIFLISLIVRTKPYIISFMHNKRDTCQSELLPQ